MTRKDTILIAVVINAGLLALLFTTAVIYDTDKAVEQTELTTSLVENKVAQPEPAKTLIAEASSTGDEVDNVLKYYSSPSSQPIVVETAPEVYVPEPIAIQSNAPDDEEISPQDSENLAQGSFKEIKVKKGDVLEKIAKANKTSVAAIKKANNLKNATLSIGQTLKIPVKQRSVTIAENSETQKKEVEKEEPKAEVKQEQPKEEEVVYHIVKSGDNPWKIAKQYNVKYDDILRLNKLDEEKARNLKIGDRIRVK